MTVPGEFAVEFSRLVKDVIDGLAPKVWDVTVWVDGNYLTGRMDGADRNRLVMTVAEAVLSASKGVPDGE